MLHSGYYKTSNPACVAKDQKKPGLNGRAKSGISLGVLIPNGPLREASGPAPGFSAFENNIKADSLTHPLDID